MKNITENITVGQLLDLIDDRRESEEIVEIMRDGGDNAYAEVRAMVCSKIWDSVEDMIVNSIRAEGDKIQMWLDY